MSDKKNNFTPQAQSGSLEEPQAHCAALDSVTDQPRRRPAPKPARRIVTAALGKNGAKLAAKAKAALKGAK